MFSSPQPTPDTSPVNQKKRTHSKADIEPPEFDMNAWLVNNGDALTANLLAYNFMPLMKNYRGNNASAIYRLFAEETNRNILIAMVDLLQLLFNTTSDCEYFYDVLAIYRFLLHKKEFSDSLDALESSLQHHVRTNLSQLNLPTNQLGKLYIPCHDLEKTKCHKILSSYMYAWAKLHGFEYKAKLLYFMSELDFLNLLTTKTIIKDSSTSLIAEHGMWSHSIQWWAVFYQQTNTHFLNHSPLEVYQQFGKFPEAVWNTVFDRGPSSLEYTSPEYVSGVIASHEDELPLLSATVKRQRYKIENKETLFGKGYKTKLAEKHKDRPDLQFCKYQLK